MLVLRGIVDPLTACAPWRSSASPTACASRVRGRDGRHRATTVTADRPVRAAANAPATLRFSLALPAGRHGGDRAALPALRGRGGAAGARPSAAACAARRSSAQTWLAERTSVETDDELFNRVLRRSLLDIRMLHSRLDSHGYYAAGVPWYATLFGRDSLICAMQMLAFDPPMAAQTLRVLAGLLAKRDDPAHDAEPGKVLHELRVGEVAQLGLSPLAATTARSTPRRSSSACCASTPTGAATWRCSEELRGDVEAMLAWIDGPGDRNRDGLLEYRQRAPAGLRNQGWKDSDEGVLDEHGTPLVPPTTLVEPQGYVLRAKRRLARLFPLAGDEARANELLRRGRRDARAARALLAPRARLLLDGLRRRRSPERGPRLQPGPPAVGARAARRRARPRCATR